MFLKYIKVGISQWFSFAEPYFTLDKKKIQIIYCFLTAGDKVYSLSGVYKF